MTSSELDSSLKLAWALANREAQLSDSRTIEPIHILGAVLLIVDDCALSEAEAIGMSAGASEALARLAAEGRERIGLPAEVITAVRREVTKSLRHAGQSHSSALLHRSEESRALFEEAVCIAEEQGDTEVNVLHLLEALIRRMPAQTGSDDGFLGLVRQLEERSKAAARGTGLADGKSAGADVVGELGRDLTALAREGRLPPMMGRKRELTVLARHLQRTTKRNVLIIGEAGVGKTAIVEGFAQRIADREVPDFLRDLRIVQINVSDLVAGTHYRGDMEQRLKNVIEQATADPNLVLFLDEVHLVVSAGAGGGAPMDVANILKPALSRDDFRCIGATTVEDYERHIKADGAFLRRFQLLRVPEPTVEECVSICNSWALRIERMQEVVFEEGTVLAAVELSVEFVRGRSLPDKAIDLLENAAVLVKVATLSPESRVPTKDLPFVTRQHIVAAIEEQYGISVRRSELYDTARIRSMLCEQVVGQDEAIEGLAQVLGGVGDGQSRDCPLGVFMFTGPTGTGKTYTAERLGRILFPDRPRAVIRFNMNEFKERHEVARLAGAPPGFVGHDQPGAIFRFAEANPQALWRQDRG